MRNNNDSYNSLGCPFDVKKTIAYLVSRLQAIATMAMSIISSVIAGCNIVVYGFGIGGRSYFYRYHSVRRKDTTAVVAPLFKRPPGTLSFTQYGYHF